MKIRKRVLNREIIESDCVEWAKDIKQSFQPDLVVFIAKSGFLFAKPMLEVFGCPMASIIASRPKTSSKDKAKGIIKLIPQSIILSIITSPLMYKMNEKKKERHVSITSSLNKYSDNNIKNILLVDDSVDTGWTILAAKDALLKIFTNANIKIASYTVIEISEKRSKVDYFRVKNEVILTATSRHSDEYDIFISDYEQWQDNANKI